MTTSNDVEKNATHRPSPVSSSLENIVPACPPGLSIKKGDFLKQDFSVDKFFIEVGVREGGAGLDVLRDDLGIYLKVLLGWTRGLTGSGSLWRGLRRRLRWPMET